MIPKDISAIGWPDIEQLITNQREEDDTIEFKSAFKGGDDFLALNDKARDQAIDALAREVIAFLNTRGADIIIGLSEADGTRAIASEIIAVPRPDESADRIARSLSAVIESAQTNVAVRSFASPTDDKRGVILIRVQPSLRAPHRSKRTREAYARRGSEAVPMAMDEIQDLTINRTRLRLEQLEFLDRQFDDFRAGRVAQRQFGPEALHIRVVAIPFVEQSITIDDDTLMTLGNTNPAIYDAQDRKIYNDVAFRGLYSGWKPLLRGRKQESYEAHGDGEHPEFQFSSKRIKTNGITVFDYAAMSSFSGSGPMVHFEWLVGFLAQISDNLKSLSKKIPSTLPATVRVGFRSTGTLNMGFGRSGWQRNYPVPADTFFLPDFLLADDSQIDDFFVQCQLDLSAIVEMTLKDPYHLHPKASEQ